jgi:hypothetical protein
LGQIRRRVGGCGFENLRSSGGRWSGKHRGPDDTADQHFEMARQLCNSLMPGALLDVERKRGNDLT